MLDTATMLANADQACLVAAAGYGKTEEIVRAVALNSNSCQLVLTHTHAGVRSLRSRFKSLGVASHLYHLDTIAGWALRCASGYPTLSGLPDLYPTGDAWKDVYHAASNLLQRPFFQRVLLASYSGVYVDEYQDCVVSQHKLVLALAELLPCRILCDPLQGIFDFQKDDPVVSWSKDIKPNFYVLPELTIPWRWAKGNRQLGSWLSNFRQALLHGESIDISYGPIKWLTATPEHQWSECMKLANSDLDSVVAIHPDQNKPAKVHNFTRNLKGLYTSMEEMECRDLLKWSQKIDDARGPERAKAIIDFAGMCMTKVSTELSSIYKQFSSGKIPKISGYKKHLEICQALIDIASKEDFSSVLTALGLISQIDGRVLFRRELWYEMSRSIKTYQTGGFESLHDAAWHIRNQARVFGRKVEQRIVSRTLLIKGLEFDHIVVLNADQLNLKNLYVAMTRGSKSLTVLSERPTIMRDPFVE
ncbi:MAG: hypothetical protein AB1894_22010 [Chloroflexota bacterium]